MVVVVSHLSDCLISDWMETGWLWCLIVMAVVMNLSVFTGLKLEKDQWLSSPCLSPSDRSDITEPMECTSHTVRVVYVRYVLTRGLATTHAHYASKDTFSP